MTPQSEFAFVALVTRSDSPATPAPRARARRVFRGVLGGIDPATGRWVLFKEGAVEVLNRETSGARTARASAR